MKASFSPSFLNYVIASPPPPYSPEPLRENALRINAHLGPTTVRGWIGYQFEGLNAQMKEHFDLRLNLAHGRSPWVYCEAWRQRIWYHGGLMRLAELSAKL